MDKTYLVELVRDRGTLWDKRDKNYHKRDRRPKCSNEIEEKLKVASKY